MSTYSTRFFAGSLPDSAGILYTVPAAFVVVVRDIELANFGDASTQTEILLGIPGFVASIYRVQALAATTWTQWQGRVVLNAGDTIGGYATPNTVNAIVSGYLLNA